MHAPLPSRRGPESGIGQAGVAGDNRNANVVAPPVDGVVHPVDAPQADARIGALLHHAGKLNADGIEHVLRMQRESGLRFGAAAMRLGLVDQDAIDAAIARQFAYPVAARGESTLSPQLVAAFHPASAQGDTLRAVRSQLLLRWFGTGQHALAVSGVGPGDASSVLAANLALVFAQLGHRTLLVDANLRHGIQHGLFGLHAQASQARPGSAPPGPALPGDVRALASMPVIPSPHGAWAGLSDVLGGRAGLDAITPVAGFPALSLLASGTVPPNPQELLERASFAALHAQLGELYDVVLYDIAPTSHGAEALAVAAHAGAALLVAQKDRTPVAALKRLAQQMAAVRVAVIGSVLVEA